MTRLFTLIAAGLVFASAPASAQEGTENGSEEREATSESETDRVELPDLGEAPDEGVDPDIELAVEKAEASMREGRPAEAVWQVRSLYLTEDRYTRAQRDRTRGDARRLLLEAGDQLMSSGDRMMAAQALDAAWILGEHGASPKYADLLVRLAQERRSSNEAEALYLARRAERVDPGNHDAERLDRDISREPLATPGLITTGVGAVGLVAALVFKSRLSSLEDEIESGGTRSELDDLIGQYRTNRTFFGISGAVAGVGLAGGGLMLSIQLKNFNPVSPKLLPAFPERDE